MAAVIVALLLGSVLSARPRLAFVVIALALAGVGIQVTAASPRAVNAVP
jgi:hypothetical protein